MNFIMMIVNLEHESYLVTSSRIRINSLLKTLTQVLMKKKTQIRASATARQNVGVLDSSNDDSWILQRLLKLGFSIIQDYLTSA